MRNITPYIVFLLLLAMTSSCQKEGNLLAEDVRHKYWLEHKEAELPITVEGNTASNVFFLMVHGGPGASSHEFNSFTKEFSNEIESDFAMVYYDQRNAGLSRGPYIDSLYSIEQHIEDLDQVIQFLKFKYGEQIKIILASHSWGGYLSTAYLLDQERAQNITVWVNIDGGLHRNLFVRSALVRIFEICDLEIVNGNPDPAWANLSTDVTTEFNKGILQYDKETEKDVFDLIRRAENLINADDFLLNETNTTFRAIYWNNYQPFVASSNGNIPIEKLIDEMYSYDRIIAASLGNIQNASLFVYGFYDVRTSFNHANVVLNELGTPAQFKNILLLGNSGHAPMRNEPFTLALEIKDFISLFI